ncbi:MAG: GNAT family N-acetyltransferase [Anaerolineales bacterium]|nr:GNAT family N-acetyltransferase [Anaerolineales bacterium]
MSPLDYLHLQLRLEGKGVIDGNLLRQMEVVPDEELPLLLVAQLANGNLVSYFDEALQTDLKEELAMQIASISFPKINPLIAILQSRNVIFEVEHYKTHIFPDTYAPFENDSVKCYSKNDPKIEVYGFGGFAKPVYAIEQDGKIVSACASTRENNFCGEAWVYTDEEHRHQGLAQKVVSVWANNLKTAGKVPFYSHKIQNSASANLAKRLGLQSVFEEIVILYTNV